MPIDQDYNISNFHKKFGKLFYDISPDIDQDEDLIIVDGAPDATQNPNAVFIGATDQGYEFSSEPTVVEEEIDESDTPVEVNVDSLAAQISFDSLEVTDLERQAALLPAGNFSENTVAGLTHLRITGGGTSLSLPTRPVAVISPEKTGGYMYAILWAAYNSAAHQMQFKRRERSKQNMVLKGLAVAERDDGDRVYRIGKQVPVIVISSVTPVTPAGQQGVVYPGKTFVATGGIAPYVWTVDSGALPTGLVLSTGGVLTGTPTASGLFNYTLKATDAYGRFITKAFAQTVAVP